MRPRRILLAISSLSCGGAERMMTELAHAFADRNDSVGVLTLSESGSDHYRLDDRIERIALNVIWDSKSVWQSLISNWRRNRMIRAAIRRFRPDVVVSFIEQTNVRVLAAALGLHVPVVVSERIDPRRHRVERAWNAARRLLYPMAASVVVQTSELMDWARTVSNARRVHVIPNFLRALPPPPPDDAREQGRVLAVGRLSKQKGFDLLLRAFASSGWAARGLRLSILGEGPERQSLETLANQLGIAHAVEMPGIVQFPENWMARATIFVLPSRYEGFPNALLEAMAMGCPVIATDCDTGPREIIQHGVNGLLVPVEDVGALVVALHKLIDDTALRARLGAEAVKVRERYSKDAIVDQWEKLIEEVVE